MHASSVRLPTSPEPCVALEHTSARRFLELIQSALQGRCAQHEATRSLCALAAFLRWFGRRPELVQRSDVRCYLMLMREGGAPRTAAQGALTAIRLGFDELSGRSVTRSVTVPRLRGADAPLSPDQVVRLLHAAPSLRDTALLSLLYSTGARLGELLRARWSDLDPESATLELRSPSQSRKALLPQRVLELLAALARTGPREGFIFAARRAQRGHLNARTARRIMRRAAILAQLPAQTPCAALRSALAAHLLERSWDVDFVQRRLVHCDLERTVLLISADASGPLSQGNLQLCPRLGPIERRANVVRAHATMELHFVTGRAFIPSIRLLEPRPGEVLVRLPPAEVWIEELPQVARASAESPRFFLRLAHALGASLRAKKTA